MICDKIFNEHWHKKLESAQCNAVLAVAEAIKGISTVKLYQDLSPFKTDIS